MVQPLPRLHDPNNGCVDDQLPVVIYLLGQLVGLRSFLLLRAQDWQLDLEAVVMVRKVNREKVVGLEVGLLRELIQDLKLAERDKVRLELMVSDLHVLKKLLVRHFLLIVEQGQDHHLEGTHSDLVSFGAVVTDLGPQFCATLIKLPVELPSGELRKIVLLKN